MMPNKLVTMDWIRKHACLEGIAWFEKQENSFCKIGIPACDLEAMLEHDSRPEWADWLSGALALHGGDLADAPGVGDEIELEEPDMALPAKRYAIEAFGRDWRGTDNAKGLLIRDMDDDLRLLRNRQWKKPSNERWTPTLIEEARNKDCRMFGALSKRCRDAMHAQSFETPEALELAIDAAPKVTWKQAGTCHPATAAETARDFARVYRLAPGFDPLKPRRIALATFLGSATRALNVRHPRLGDLDVWQLLKDRKAIVLARGEQFDPAIDPVPTKIEMDA